jgi:cell division protein FtsI (penicillin-binding protein 3)
VFNGLVFNRVSNQVYELGSTFKPITVAAAIDAGVITDLSVRYPTGPLNIGGFTIHDSHNFGPSLNVPKRWSIRPTSSPRRSPTSSAAALRRIMISSA